MTNLTVGILVSCSQRVAGRGIVASFFNDPQIENTLQLVTIHFDINKIIYAHFSSPKLT